MKKTLRAVREFRAGDDATPIVLMGYYNPIYIYGVEKFLADAKAPASTASSSSICRPRKTRNCACRRSRPGFNFIRLATPTTDDKRLPAVLANTSGFVYYVSITGITGAAAPDPGKVTAAVARIKRHTKLPVCVGFGVRTAEQARAIARAPTASWSARRWSRRSARVSCSRAPNACTASCSGRPTTQARQPAWEPPVDILETEFEVLALVALPGVDADNAQAVIEDGDLVIAGTRAQCRRNGAPRHPPARTAAGPFLPAAAAAGRALQHGAPAVSQVGW
jgi:hypothetical protein